MVSANLSRLIHVGSYLAVMIMSSALTMALMVVFTYLWSAPAPSYVEFAQPVANMGALCAGQHVTQTIALTVKAPAVLSTVVSVLSSKGDLVLPNTVLFTTASPVAHDIVDEAPWTVPALPPGHYQRVVGVTTYGRSSTPAFLITHFEIVPCANP